MNKKYNKTAAFTDIHWGARMNSELHNQDCERFIDWFCEQVKGDPEIDNIIFMGDWYEVRAALNIMTLNYSHRGAKKLNDLGLPVYFIIGNHDLYHRHTRALYSTITFEEFSNFIIVNEPKVYDEIGTGALLSPYLFHDEYSKLTQYLNLDTWWGHFEFKGFIVTGYNMKMPTGPDPAMFAGPDHIFSGHFHKRQTEGNITYIGNAFPSNFGDAGDFKRGMAVYDHQDRAIAFTDWKECPKYVHVKLSALLDGTVTLPQIARVKCRIDEDVTIEESTAIKDSFIKKYNLRELTMEETSSEDLGEALSNTDTDVDANADTSELHTVDDLVIKMLSDISVDSIDNALLIEEYKALHD